jgi:hypothetical protein
LMVVSASKSLLADGSAKTPFFLGLYILAVGAGKHICPMHWITAHDFQLCSSQTSPPCFSTK